MTKYKEFMRAKGIMLRCDFVAMSDSDFDPMPYTDFYDVEFLGTEVLDNGVMAAACSNAIGREYVVLDRCGDCTSFKHDKYMAYIEESRCPYEYTAWIQESCNMLPRSVYRTVIMAMEDMYADDAKVRTAFRHMRAGIMTPIAFNKLLARYCEKLTAIDLTVEC